MLDAVDPANAGRSSSEAEWAGKRGISPQIAHIETSAALSSVQPFHVLPSGLRAHASPIARTSPPTFPASARARAGTPSLVARQGQECTVRSDAHAIAGIAICVGRAGDEADAKPRVVPSRHVPRGAAIGIARAPFVFEQMPQARAHLEGTDELFGGQIRPFADPHHFDEARHDPSGPCPLNDRVELVVVLVAKDDRIGLELFEAGAPRLFDAGENSFEPAPARDPPEAHR